MKKIIGLSLLLVLAFSQGIAISAAPIALTILSKKSIREVSEREEAIATLISAIDKLKQTKGLPDDVYRETLSDLIEKLAPLLDEQIGYLTGQRDAFLSNESNTTVKASLQKSFNKNIERMRDIKGVYSVSNILAITNNTDSGTSSRSIGSRGANSDSAVLETNTLATKPVNTSELFKTGYPALLTPNVKKPALPIPLPPVKVDSKTTTDGNGKTTVTAEAEKKSRMEIQEPFKGDKKIRGTVVIDNADNLTVPQIRVTPPNGAAQTINVVGNIYSFVATLAPLPPLNEDDIVSVELIHTPAGAAAAIPVLSTSFVVSDPTKQGLFGVLYSGVVVSRQAQTVNEAAPFMGFQVGWGSGVKIKGKDSSGNPITDVREAGFWQTSRWSIRFQGMFSNEGRAAIATPTESPLPPGQPSRPFPFIHHRESFSPEFTVWREWGPLKTFSFGLYGTVGATTVLDSNKTEDQLITDRETNLKIKSSVISNGGTKFYGELGSVQHLKFNPGNFLLQNFAGAGYYEAYRGTKYHFGTCVGAPTDTCKLDAATRFRFVDKLRIFPEGLSVNFGRQIKGTPMFGIDLNVGAGPDNVRFFTGFAIRLKGFDGKTVEDK